MTSTSLLVDAAPGARLSPSGSIIWPRMVIGYRRDGRPIYLVAGASADDDGGTGADDGAGDDGTADGAGEGDDGDTSDGEGDDAKEEDAGAKDGDRDGDTADGKAKPRPKPAPPKEKVEDLPPVAQKIIKEARADAAKARAAAKEAADTATKAARDGMAREIGKALGLITDDAKEEPPDPEKLAAELTAARDQHREAQVELAVFKTASKLDANAAELLDSRAFAAKVHKLDPAADDFAAKLKAAIKTAVDDNPRKYKNAAGQAPAAATGANFGGGPGERSDDPERMSIDDFRAARRKST